MIDENSTFGGFLTTIGEAKQANANALKTHWKLTHLLLGDANGNDPVPDPDQTQLVNQVYRAAINQLSIDPDNPGILIAEVVLPPTIGGWWIRELGIEDEDGDFVAVANCPPSYKPLLAQGSGRNQVVRMHLILSNTANVELKVDPSVVLATREYVDSQRTEHEASRNHPLATTTERGMVEKATTDEAKNGAADKYPDAAAMRAAIDEGAPLQNFVTFDKPSITKWDLPEELRDGRRKAYVLVTAGGGGGAEGEQGYRGAAGGAGGTIIASLDLTGIDSVTITVGDGGLGGTPVATGGETGQSSSFGSFITAFGGFGAGVNPGGGGGSGVSAAPDSIILKGGFGSDGTGPGSGAGGGCGDGGASYWGGGGRSGSGHGFPGQAPGSGGGGSTGGVARGAKGATGIIYVRW